MANDSKHAWLHGEPAVEELIAERITRLVMTRDRLSPRDVRAALEAAATALRESEASRSGQP